MAKNNDNNTFVECSCSLHNVKDLNNNFSCPFCGDTYNPKTRSFSKNRSWFSGDLKPNGQIVE